MIKVHVEPEIVTLVGARAMHRRSVEGHKVVRRNGDRQPLGALTTGAAGGAEAAVERGMITEGTTAGAAVQEGGRRPPKANHGCVHGSLGKRRWRSPVSSK